jgi:hypothetical protein
MPHHVKRQRMGFATAMEAAVCPCCRAVDCPEITGWQKVAGDNALPQQSSDNAGLVA